jgi:hypothetical protein
MDFFITPESYLAAVRSPCCRSCFRRISSRLSIRELCALRRTRALLRWLNTNRPQLTVAVYGVGAGAVDPSGTGEGASVEPCVFGGFLFADLFEAGVDDGLLVAAVVVLVPDYSRLFARRQKRHADQDRDQGAVGNGVRPVHDNRIT